MNIDLQPEIAQGLQALASAQGLSIEDYLQRLVARELPATMTQGSASTKSGMVLGERATGLQDGHTASCTLCRRKPSRVCAMGDRSIFWATTLEAIFRHPQPWCPCFTPTINNHDASARVYIASTKDDFCARRSLGEVYATMTGLPARPRITGPEAISMVEQIRERMTMVSLDDSEYLSALNSASPSVIGSAFYDWLIARCAVKAKATSSDHLECQTFHSVWTRNRQPCKNATRSSCWLTNGEP